MVRDSIINKRLRSSYMPPSSSVSCVYMWVPCECTSPNPFVPPCEVSSPLGACMVVERDRMTPWSAIMDVVHLQTHSPSLSDTPPPIFFCFFLWVPRGARERTGVFFPILSPFPASHHDFNGKEGGCKEDHGRGGWCRKPVRPLPTRFLFLIVPSVLPFIVGGWHG